MYWSIGVRFYLHAIPSNYNFSLPPLPSLLSSPLTLETTHNHDDKRWCTTMTLWCSGPHC